MQSCDFEITPDIQFCQQNIIKICGLMWSQYDQKGLTDLGFYGFCIEDYLRLYIKKFHLTETYP